MTPPTPPAPPVAAAGADKIAAHSRAAALDFILTRYAHPNGEPRDDMPAWAHVISELLIGLPVTGPYASPWLAALDEDEAALPLLVARVRALEGAAKDAARFDEARCYPDDHGAYYHPRCGICRAEFYGGKGRNVCRVCEPVGDELARLRLTYEPQRWAEAFNAALPHPAAGGGRA